MGRGRKPRTEQQRQAPWREEKPAYTYWSGVDSFRSPRAAPKTRPRSRPSFPAYDTMAADPSGITEVISVRDAPSRPRNSGLVQDVQQAVNAARKVEQKLSKLKADLAQRKNSWVKWVQGMLQAYTREQTRYQHDRSRLVAEIGELELQRQNASQDIRRVALEVAATPAQERAALMEIDAEIEDTALGPELAKILSSAAGDVAGEAAVTVTPARSARTAPRTPTHPATPGVGATTRDPYMTSPSMAHFGLHSAAPPGLERADSMPTNPAPTPTTAAESAGPEALSTRLSAKRHAARQALAPFGIPPRESEEGHQPVGERPVSSGPQASPAPAAASLVDDDPDEVMQAAHSPGLTRLE